MTAVNHLPEAGEQIRFGYIPTIGDYVVGLQYYLSNGDFVTVYPSPSNDEEIRANRDYRISKVKFASDFPYGYLGARHHVISVMVA